LSDIRILEGGDEDEASDRDLAIHIGQVLERHYPNHPFIIGFQGRGLVIRHLAIASEMARIIGREGFATLLPREKLGTPKEVTHAAVMFAGELLETFQLPRGAWDGRLPVVPSAWKYKQDRAFQ
jgi:hypothetical protein